MRHTFTNTEICLRAGGHYNPFGQTHGTYQLPERGRYAKDLINNVESDSKGRIKLTFSDDLVTLYGPYVVFGPH